MFNDCLCKQSYGIQIFNVHIVFCLHQCAQVVWFWSERPEQFSWLE